MNEKLPSWIFGRHLRRRKEARIKRLNQRISWRVWQIHQTDWQYPLCSPVKESKERML